MMITLFGLPTSTCQACKFTEKRMEYYGLEATKVRVDEDEGAMERIQALGHSQAPVVIVEEGGNVIDHWSGFQESKLESWAKKLA